MLTEIILSPLTSFLIASGSMDPLPVVIVPQTQQERPAKPKAKRLPSEALMQHIMHVCPAGDVGVKVLARLSGKRFNSYFRSHVAELSRRGHLVLIVRGTVRRNA